MYIIYLVWCKFKLMKLFDKLFLFLFAVDFIT